MITQLRSSLKNGIFKVIIWATVLILGLGSLVTVFDTRKAITRDTWAFMVNNQKISQADVAREIDRQRMYIAHMRALYGDYADLFLKNIDVQEIAMATVQQEELLNQVAMRQKICIDPEFLAEKLYDRQFLFTELAGLVPPTVLTEQGINQKALHTYLSHKGLSMRAFEDKLAQCLTRHIIEEVINVAAYTPFFILKNMYTARYVPKKLSYLYVELSHYLKKAEHKGCTPDDLAHFYEQHKQNYLIPEKRTGTVWTFDASKFDITFNEETIEAYYNKHKTDPEYIDKPARVQVRTIVFSVEDPALRNAIRQQVEQIHAQLIQDPSRFEQEARKLSTDQETKNKGGLMPFFTKGEKDPLFERAAFLLQSPGDISSILETEKGFELIQLVEKQPKVIKPLALVKENIRKQLINKRFKNIFDAEIKKIMIAQERDAHAISSFAHDKGAQQQALTNIIKGATRESQALFTIKNVNGLTYYKQEGQDQQDQGIVIQLTEIVKQYIPALKNIEHTVKKDFYKQSAQQALEKELKEAQKKCATQSLSSLREQLGGNSASSDWLDVQKPEELTQFLPRHISCDFLDQLDMVGSTILRITAEGGIIIKVDALKEFDSADFALKKPLLEAEIARKNEQFLIKGFVASLYRNATIESNSNIPFLQK